MNHPDQDYGIRPLPPDSPALKELKESLRIESRYPIGFAPNVVQQERNRRFHERARSAVEETENIELDK